MALCYDLMEMVGTQVEQIRSREDHKKKLKQVLMDYMDVELVQMCFEPYSGNVEYGSYVRDDCVCNLLQSDDIPECSVYGRVFLL